MCDKFVPSVSLHPVGGSGSGSTFTLVIGAIGTSSSDKHYITPALHECLVLMEPKHRNIGI